MSLRAEGTTCLGGNPGPALSADAASSRATLRMPGMELARMSGRCCGPGHDVSVLLWLSQAGALSGWDLDLQCHHDVRTGCPHIMMASQIKGPFMM